MPLRAPPGVHVRVSGARASPDTDGSPSGSAITVLMGSWWRRAYVMNHNLQVMTRLGVWLKDQRSMPQTDAHDSSRQPYSSTPNSCLRTATTEVSCGSHAAAGRGVGRTWSSVSVQI